MLRGMSGSDNLKIKYSLQPANDVIFVNIMASRQNTILFRTMWYINKIYKKMKVGVCF